MQAFVASMSLSFQLAFLNLKVYVCHQIVYSYTPPSLTPTHLPPLPPSLLPPSLSPDIMELKRMMEKLGQAKTHLELKKMIAEVDTNNSGAVHVTIYPLRPQTCFNPLWSVFVWVEILPLLTQAPQNSGLLWYLTRDLVGPHT